MPSYTTRWDTISAPAEALTARADHRAPNMGLQAWPKGDIRKQDVTVSKNYLATAEIRERNRLTTTLLDIFEDQADLGHLVVMEDATRLLDAQLIGLGRTVLHSGGNVSREQARQHVHAEWAQFDAMRKAKRHAEADRAIAELPARQSNSGGGNKRSA